MSAHTGSPQVRLANEIAAQFRHRPPEEASAAIARHIRMFWDPRMVAELLRLGETGTAALDPLALGALPLLR
ncbi:formate dehydrogenase subunit delta [Amycolatopsis nigrescens]|uniref:formate dehydrogenase subunit delta n=1 Tax=Amycolatopsis nigrescens TaxID=381445 RepID=UPI000381AF2D|nr:formate dehydrogenase subunit delta [Amycolatopsis nigrescens]